MAVGTIDVTTRFPLYGRLSMRAAVGLAKLLKRWPRVQGLVVHPFVFVAVRSLKFTAKTTPRASCPGPTPSDAKT